MNEAFFSSSLVKRYEVNTLLDTDLLEREY